MTTIAANTTQMACDSKASLGNVHFLTPKIARKGRALIGAAGDSGPCVKFINWYGSGRKAPKLGEDDSMNALVLNSDGLWFYGVDFEAVFVADGAFAIGSGDVAALTAMRVYGALPGDAVMAACQIDDFSMPPVHVFDLHETKKRRVR